MTTAAFALAICSLVIGSLSLGWQVAAFLLTSGRVKVRASFALGLGALEAYDFIVVTAANVGRHPVSVRSFALQLPNKRTLVEPQSFLEPVTLPAHLQPGEEVSFNYDLHRIKAACLREGIRTSDLTPTVRTTGDKAITGKRLKGWED